MTVIALSPSEVDLHLRGVPKKMMKRSVSGLSFQIPNETGSLAMQHSQFVMYFK